MNHVYATHIEKKNLNGYVVNGSVPFLKLYDAEEFCMAEGVKPDKDHLVFDPKNARILAIMMRPEVLRLKDQFELKCNAVREKITVQAQKRDMLKKNNNLVSDAEAAVVQERICELIGHCNSLSETWSVLQKREYELFFLSRLTTQDQ